MSQVGPDGMRPLDRIRAIRDSAHEANEKLLLMALVLRVNNQTLSRIIGIDDLAEDTSMSRRTVERTLLKLRKHPAVVLVNKRSLESRKTRSQYTLQLQNLKQRPEPPPRPEWA